MKSIIIAAIALVGFSAAAPPSYKQYPRNYPVHEARDANPGAYTVVSYPYKTVKEYGIVPRDPVLEPRITALAKALPDLSLKREAKPVPKYKQYKAPPKYGSRKQKKRQDLPAVPAVPSTDDIVPAEVPAVPAVAKRQVPDAPDVSDVTDLPTSTVPQIGSVA